MATDIKDKLIYRFIFDKYISLVKGQIKKKKRLLKMFVKHSWRHCDRKKSVFGFYRTVRNDSDDVGNFKRS